MRLLKRTLVVLLPVALAALGWFAGATLARLNPRVRLAGIILAGRSVSDLDRQEAEQAFARFQQELRDRPEIMKKIDGPLTEEKARDLLRGEAEGVRRTFRIGGSLLGLWCGMAAAVRIASLSRVQRRRDYEIEHRICVSCGRCFMSCPREHLRRKQLKEAP